MTALTDIHLPVALAKAFADELRAELPADEFRQVVERNAAEAEDSNICHSHDFCDANMTMLVAFEKTVGRDIDLESNVHTNLWNTAWTLAKASGFDAERIR